MSDTLVTKVLLGTFGCLPACDTYFIAGFKASGFPYSYLNGNFIERVLVFCRENRSQLADHFFSEFAPYAAHILKVNLFSYLGLAAGHLSAKKNSLVDIAYLYYLPFCMVFVPGDKLHRTAAPYFLGPGQTFIWAPDLKAELARLDAHFSQLPEDVRAQGMYSFASNPPQEGDFLTTQLWDRFLPAWRRRTEESPTPSPEAHARLLAELDAMDSAPVTSAHVTTDNASYLISKRMIPVSSGKWRIMPPGIEDKPDS